MNDGLFTPPAEVRQADHEIINAIIAAHNKGSNSSWEAADGFAELAKRNWTQDLIAKACKVSQQFVSKCLQCVRLHNPGSKRPSFCEAYRSVKDGKKAQPEEGTVHQDDPDPIEKTLTWMASRVESLVEKLGKTRVLGQGEASKAVQGVQNALKSVRKLADAKVRSSSRKKCNKCGQDIIWAVTSNNKWIKLNGEQETFGDYEIINEVAVKVVRDGKTKYYKSHFGSCFPASKEPVFEE